MHLERGLCEQFCAQVTFLNRSFGKCSLEREHPFLKKVVLIMNSCFIQYNAPLVKRCQRSSKDKLAFSKATGILLHPDQLHYLLVTNSFVNGTRQNWDCLYQSWFLHVLFFYHYILSISGQKILPRNFYFQCLPIVAFQLQLVYVSQEKFLEL